MNGSFIAVVALLVCGVVVFVLGGLSKDAEGDAYAMVGVFIFVCGLVGAFWFACDSMGTKEAVYPSTAVVVSVDRENDVVVCVDGNGEEWQFTEADDWFVGDLVSMLMNDKGTPSIYDDEIVSVRYSRLAIIED